MQRLLSIIGLFSVFTLIFMSVGQPIVFAQTGAILGVHILHPGELSNAKQLVAQDDSESWHYVTIPLSLNDLHKQSEWQEFFDQARVEKVIPIVRLTTTYDQGNWKIPTREETLKLLTFLNELNWPTEDRYIIVFNEVNHKQEWGGIVDPEAYATILRFVGTWAQAQPNRYLILPAAMDLAAPNGPTTMEAFTYLKKMQSFDKDVFAFVDYWNSHSYPNPGFSSSPERKTQDSLRGFQHELAYLKKITQRDYQVFITETGWASNQSTNRWLESYYYYALQHVWSDPQVIAVTPFLLKGDPGPFKKFTFLDRNDQPTLPYAALQKALTKWREST